MKAKTKDKILIIIFLCVVLMALLKCFGVLPLPKYALAIVRGPSMTGYLTSGDICITKRVDDPSDISINDVIVFNVPEAWEKYTSSKKIIHRIVYVDTQNNCYLTKGDGNSYYDPSYIDFDSILYKEIGVFKWPHK